MDPKAALARRCHREAEASMALARQRRAQRDRLILQLRAEDPEFWSYGRLAKAVGISKELVRLVIKEAA